MSDEELIAAHLRVGSLSYSTRRQRASTLRRFVAFLAGRGLLDATAADVGAWACHVAGRGAHE